MDEKVKPLTKEYSKKNIFAVTPFILAALADNTNTNMSSAISSTQCIPLENTFISIFSFIDTTYPVANVTIKPSVIHKNTFGISLFSIKNPPKNIYVLVYHYY